MTSLKKSLKSVASGYKRAVTWATTGLMTMGVTAAQAGITDDAIAAINANKTDALAVGGVVLGVIATVAVIGLIGSLIKRA